jgi:pilus assembly protein CpaE
MAILDLSDRAYIVVENVVPTMQTVRGFFELLEDVEFSEAKQRLVLNRFTKAGGNPGQSEVEGYLERDVDFIIPFDRAVVQAANIGQPFVSSAGRFSKSAKAVRAIADEIETIETAGPSPQAGVSAPAQPTTQQPRIVQPEPEEPALIDEEWME